MKKNSIKILLKIKDLKCSALVTFAVILISSTFWSTIQLTFLPILIPSGSVTSEKKILKCKPLPTMMMPSDDNTSPFVTGELTMHFTDP